MRLLVDGWVLLRWLDGSGRLSPDAVRAIRSRVNEVYVSVASLWQFTVMASTGTLQVDVDLRGHLTEQLFTELPVTGPHVADAGALPPHHADPVDRLLVAQARCENLVLVTDNPELSPYELRILRA